MSDSNLPIDRQYKSRLFSFTFGSEDHKDWTLSLYNAVNNSDYKDPSVIEFNTLKDVLFMGMQNDTSFLIADIMSVYEHQSTFNPNMPLRLLQYVGELYAGYIAKNKYNKYGKKLIPLPTPKLVAFYNGEDEAENEVILRLSDSFSPETRDKADIEVTVRMININHGRNKALMAKCKPLAEYSWFINTIRTNQRNGHDLAAAVDLALSSMPEEYELKAFLIMHKQEVQSMLDTEYNEAEVMEMFKEDGRKEGASSINKLNSLLISMGRLDDLKKATEDTEYQEKLIKELLP